MAVDVSIARPELLQVADAVAREKMIEREEVLEFAYLNSTYQSGLKNLLDNL